MVTAVSAATTTSASAGATAKLAESFDTFLKLLTTQLQFQDPLDPMDSNAFTEQLVSFTGVEQSIQTNKNLESLIAMMGSSGLASATSYIGKAATMKSAVAGLKGGQAEWTYALGSTADSLSLQVFDSRGRKVTELDGPKTAGAHQLKWDGTDSFGRAMPDGQYSLRAVAKSAAGSDITTSISVTGTVDAVEAISGETMLLINGTPQRLADLLRVGAASTTPSSSLQ